MEWMLLDEALADEISSEGEISDNEDNQEEGEVMEEEEEEGDWNADRWIHLEIDEFEQHVAEAREKMQVDKLKFLLSMREKWCEALQSELNKEHVMMKKKQNLEELDKQMKKFAKVENDLTESLVNSRNGTPVPTHNKLRVSWVTSSVKKIDQKKRVVATKVKPENVKHTLNSRRSPDKQGESLFSSFMALRQGKNDEFNELLTKAMQANKNINTMNSKFPVEGGNVSTALTDFEKVWNPLGTVVANADSHAREHSHLIDVSSDRGCQELIALLEKLRFKHETEGVCGCTSGNGNEKDAESTEKGGGQKTDAKN